MGDRPDPGGPPFVILGLWGGTFADRRLTVDAADGDDLAARFEF